MRVQLILDDIPTTLYVLRLSTPKGDLIQIQTARGVPVDAFQFNFLQILEASEDELNALRDGGYWAAAAPGGALTAKAA